MRVCYLIDRLCLHSVWPDGNMICKIFDNLQQWKFAQWDTNLLKYVPEILN